MASQSERAQSFGGVADAYDRLRPSPAPASLEWLVPDGCDVAVDVAAGTGLFTRALAPRVGRVIAVEPDARMRHVLAQRSPEVDVREGTGEKLPLADETADALFVASAWHWLDPDRAVPECARVLRDGGRFGVLWTSRDRDVEWVRGLDRAPDESPLDPAAEAGHRRRRDVSIPPGGQFRNAERASFGYLRDMPIDDVVEMVGTYSGVITAPKERRRTILDTARSTLAARFPGAETVPLPIRTWCWRADRAAR